MHRRLARACPSTTLDPSESPPGRARGFKTPLFCTKDSARTSASVFLFIILNPQGGVGVFGLSGGGIFPRGVVWGWLGLVGGVWWLGFVWGGVPAKRIFNVLPDNDGGSRSSLLAWRKGNQRGTTARSNRGRFRRDETLERGPEKKSRAESLFSREEDSWGKDRLERGKKGFIPKKEQFRPIYLAEWLYLSIVVHGLREEAESEKIE